MLIKMLGYQGNSVGVFVYAMPSNSLPPPPWLDGFDNLSAVGRTVLFFFNKFCFGNELFWVEKLLYL